MKKMALRAIMILSLGIAGCSDMNNTQSGSAIRDAGAGNAIRDAGGRGPERPANDLRL